MAGHLPLRDRVAQAEGVLYSQGMMVLWAGCCGAGVRVRGSDLHFWRTVNFWLPPGEWIRSDLTQKQQEQAVVIYRRDMVPVLPLPDLPFRNWVLGGSGVVSEKSDLAGSDSRGLSSLNSQHVQRRPPIKTCVCHKKSLPSVYHWVFWQHQPVWARQERQTKPACPSLNLSWKRSLSVFLSGGLSVFWSSASACKFLMSRVKEPFLV